MNTLNGYSKSTLSNDYLLTASGGHLPKSDLFRKLGMNLDINTFADNSNKNGIVYINTTTPNDINAPFSYGSILSLNNSESSWMVACSAAGILSYRSRWWSGNGNDWSDWKTLLTTNGGALTGPLVLNGSDTDRNLIRVNCETGDANKIGNWGYTLKYLGSGTGINNALALYADNSTATTQNLATKWLNDGTMYSRSIIPHLNATYDLGTNDIKWNNIYGNLKGNADTATKLGLSTIGSITTPIYLNAGVPTAIDTKNYLKCLQIQSNLTSSGWYRIGTLNGYRSYLFSITGSFNTVNSTACSFIINKSYSNITISQIGKASITSMINKVRLVRDESSAYTIYLDVYNNYNTTTNQPFYYSLTPLSQPYNDVGASLQDPVLITEDVIPISEINILTSCDVHNANAIDGYHADSFLKVLRRVNLNISSSYSGMIPPDILSFKNGYPVYTDPEFANGTNDISVYNNGSAVTITREVSTTSGNSSGYCLHIKSAASGASPNGGGWCFSMVGTQARVSVCIFRANIPEGYNVEYRSNSIGTGANSGWLTSTEGTGKYEWYAYMVEWGASPSNSFYFTLNKAADVDWYLSYANVIDISRASYDGLRTRYSDYAISAGDADAATKLKTARTLWGLSFDGSANITGDITGVGNINYNFKIKNEKDNIATLNVEAISVTTGINYSHLYVTSNTGSNNTRPLVLQNGYGNVGIGVIAPTEKLEILGNVKATSFIGNLDWSYIQNKPTSLPANGGNADTVDNKHASDFALKTDVPKVTDYYWANIKIGETSNETSNPIFTSSTAKIFKVLSTGTGVINIQCGSALTTSRNLYLPDGSGQLIYHTNNASIGSTTKPVYITERGQATVCTYSLNATVNSGTVDKLAYYSGTNTIDDYTSNKGSNTKSIYLKAGVPTECTYSLNATVNSGTVNRLAYYSSTNEVSTFTIQQCPTNVTNIYVWGSNAGSLYYAPNVTIKNGNTVYASGGFYESSDETLKNFYNDIEIDFDKLKQIPKKLFTWKEDKTNKSNIGTSAQELLKVYPELVEQDENGLLSVAYDKLSIIALKAIDKLYEKVTELENKINNLK